jgi:hypothetical protein
MKHLLLSLILLLSLTACQDKKNDAKAQAAHDAKIMAQAKADVLAELEAKKKAELAQKSEQEKNAKLNQVGIAIDQGTIIIDTNKTKDFLQQLSQKMEIQMKKISDDLQKGIIETEEAGININNEHINIDLNKTRNLLEDWSKKIQIFVNEFDEVSNNAEINTSKGH